MLALKEVKKVMKVEQFHNKNQFHLYTTYDATEENLHELQSYDSLVVSISKKDGSHDVVVLGRDWDYSTTTSKHVYMFLEEYANINFYGITNKRAYVNKLIKDGMIYYNENMK